MFVATQLNEKPKEISPEKAMTAMYVRTEVDDMPPKKLYTKPCGNVEKVD